MTSQGADVAPPSSGWRRLRAGVLFVVSALVLPIAAMAAATAAPHDLPSLPDERVSLALPASASKAQIDLNVADLQWLPRLTSDPGRSAAAIYAGLKDDDAAGVRAMFDAAVEELAKSSSDVAADRLGSALLEIDVGGAFPDESATLDRAIAGVIDAGPDTDEQADRLNDLGVATFLFADALDPDGTGSQARPGAIRLLAAAAERYPDHPGVLVNLAFFRSLIGPGGVDVDEMVGDLDRYAQAHPDDVTARLLLASLQARRWDRDGLDDALSTLEPLFDAGETESIGHLAVGDAHVANIDRWREVQPERARQLGLLAVQSYDTVLETGGLAAAFAGRAAALDLLGQTDLALESMRRAVELNDDSAARWLQVARLERCRGDLEGGRRDANVALDRAGREGSLMSAGRMISDESPEDLGVDRGFGGVSIGSGRPARAPNSIPDTQGGYYVDPFGAAGPQICLGAETGGPGPAAESLVVDASVALGDPEGIASDDPNEPNENVLAARLVAGEPLPDGEVDLAAVLQAVSLMEPARAASMCRDLLPGAPSEFNGPATMLACVVRGSSRADRPDDVVWGLERLAPLLAADPSDPEGDVNDGEVILEGAAMLWGAGRTDDAARIYRIAAGIPAIAATALARLGDLRLDARDPRGAVVLYDLALATGAADLQQVEGEGQRTPSMRWRRLEQVIQNNRGTATLDALRDSRSMAPDCSSDPGACERAAGDFAAAVASDPGNWLYHWNAGWAARLRGDSVAAEAELARAVALDPAQARPRNDLAVLHARRGEWDQATELLRQAVAVDESFDLAAWNLGVIETRNPTTAASGQRWLAIAIERDPSLRTEPLGLRFDDQLVRVTRNPEGRLAIDRVTVGSAVAGIAFGAVAAIGGLTQLFSSIRGDATAAVTDIADPRLGGWLRRRRVAGRTKGAVERTGVQWRAWFVWLPVLMLLIATTSVATIIGVGETGVGGVILALLATGAAVLTHAAGHVIAMAPTMGLIPTRWDRGYVLALVSLVGVPAGPYPAERFVDGDERRTWWTALAGPLANLVAALIAWALSLAEPLPFLRALAAVNLAVAAYALIPAGPLDGASLAVRRPEIVVGLGLGVAVASSALALGIV